MSTTVRSQATALEIPVTIQGSKIVPGTEQRELFTETTKTTLVFENGAVVKLTAKIAPGQCVFLRNEQSGKEVLCKVIEARQAGEIGYTDLEFTSYDPKFWDAPAAKAAPAAKILTAQERLEAAANSPIASPVMEPSTPGSSEISARDEQPGDAGQRSETQKKIDEAVNNLSATPSTDSGAPGSAEVPFQAEQSAAPSQPPEAQNKIAPAERNPAVAPSVESTAPINAEIPSSLPESAPPPKTTGTLVASAAPIILESAHESLAHLSKHEPTDEELDWNPEKDAEMLAALATMSAGSKANREPAAKEANPEAASAKEKNEAASRAAADAEAKALSTAPVKTGKSRKSTSVSKPVGIGIAAVVVVTAALGIFWYMRSGRSIHVSQPPVAASTSSQPKQPAVSAPAAGSQTPASTAGAGANNAATAQNPSATPATAAAAPPSKEAEDSPAVAAAKLAARGELSRADQEVLGITHRKSNDKNADGNAPAKIVSQTAPALPDWAEGLEADRVVILDALIDEKGNVVESKPISGPRLLQQDAQRAVALWVFQPALSAGQPTASHLRLTVEFQK
jgi:periplasmic protein TonB